MWHRWGAAWHLRTWVEWASPPWTTTWRRRRFTLSCKLKRRGFRTGDVSCDVSCVWWREASKPIKTPVRRHSYSKLPIMKRLQIENVSGHISAHGQPRLHSALPTPEPLHLEMMISRCEEHFREAMGLLKKGYNESLPGAQSPWRLNSMIFRVPEWGSTR